jgi:protein TonB
MRVYTLVASVLVHVVAAVMVFVAPLLATGPLPVPRRVLAFERVVFVEPALPRPTSPITPAAAITTLTTIPIEEPIAIGPEPAAPSAPGDPALPGFDGPAGPVSVDGIGAGIVSNVVAPPPPVAAVHEPVRVGGLIQPPTKVHHVAPDYPALARDARKSGVVILEAVIAEDGTVREVRVLRSVTLLDAAAVQAVRQWRFSPTRLNGQPVPIVMTVTVAFSLQ